jgi:hypothetical protein
MFFNIDNLRDFLQCCVKDSNKYSLFIGSDPSPFAYIFYFYTKYLIGDSLYKTISEKNKIFQNLKINLNEYLILRKNELNKNNLLYDKAYLQLLCFTLSLIVILFKKPISLPKKFFYLSDDIESYLDSIKADLGKAQSGNLSMFQFIQMAYLYKLNKDQNILSKIDLWKKYFMKHKNNRGFWSKKKYFTYLEFQNSYHQHEIFIKNNNNLLNENTLSSIIKKQSFDYHFAPYPGGGSCYDYDAIYLIVNYLIKNTKSFHKYKSTLKNIHKNILFSQNIDGGFSECIYDLSSVRSLPNYLKHFINANNIITLFERVKSSLNIFFRHPVIKTHWTTKHRKWNQSSIWDTWFRLLLISKIEYLFIKNKTYLKLQTNINWKFIDFYGLGS